MRALAIVMLLAGVAGVARSEPRRDLCASGAKWRGATVDLDVKAADLHDVLRLLADVGKVNLVVSSDVAGKVTLRLRRVPWDQIACTVAAVHKLQISVQDSILMVSKRR